MIEKKQVKLYSAKNTLVKSNKNIDTTIRW